MPPFFDSAQIRDALRNQAMPAIEALAANEHLRNRAVSRFDRDGPPPYASSTESEELGDDLFAPQPGDHHPLPEELRAIIEQPIDDDERSSIAFFWKSITEPSKLYYTEAKREEARLNHRQFNRIFRGVEGCRRFGVLVRHNVKHRWEKLGVWNPEWGFPGRNAQPNDRVGAWKWKWQQGNTDDDSASGGSVATGKQLVTRAMGLRQNLCRGESVPVPPRSRLERDATASHAESFITSRPWFIFQIELAEEATRHDRLSVDQARQYPRLTRKKVVEWWKERGDWREEFDENNWVTSWKWRHESPSPEPEDLMPVTPNDDSGLDTVDWTPSEVDALEAIELPASEQPKKFWAVWNGDMPPFFPGQMLDPDGGRPPEPLSAPRASRPSERSILGRSIFGPSISEPPEPPPEERGEASRQGHEDTPPGLQEDLPGQQRDINGLQPQKPRRRRQRRGRMDEKPDPDRSPPPPRRSARIAAMKRAAEPLPSQAAPNKKPRVRPASTAAAPTTLQPAARETRRTRSRPVPARPPPESEAETRPLRERGRPRRETGPGKPSAVAKKAAKKMPAPARSRTGQGRRG
ncbi:Uncharacterized protein TCAP_06898 [Tolypocladium capitatum]|uniref:Uncharacterized protein n=1 Tax=Tolypocladium capitatum TaxID=45235 RepID=A0A2K3Q6H5_9HYPO|nr:Uncharacterized protein TCAP_06898 [Tolypocladium capitatum]